MPSKLHAAFLRRGIGAAGFLLVAVATESVGQLAHPLAGAPYAAGVESTPGARLVVFGDIRGDANDRRVAASEALDAVDARLREVGLGRESILRIRASLAPGQGEGSEFAAWNEAWSAFFAGAQAPARVTVGASGLPDGAEVILDVVAAAPVGAGVSFSGARETLNPRLRLAGLPANPTAVVDTRAGLFLASGVLPGREGDPESMQDQMRSAMNRITPTLHEHGLLWQDVFFVRVLPTPQPSRSGVDFEAWTPVFGSLTEMLAGFAPPYSMWAAPGFSASGRYVEIEVWAVPSAPTAFPMYDAAAANPLLRMTGAERSQIASGALIAPGASILFVSGVVAPEGTTPEEESAAALALMEERLRSMGASLADVAELRLYRVAPGESDALGASWNAAYGATFGTEANPHKPVRTNYLVESLPGGRHVEVEAVVVKPPRMF